MDVTLVSHTIDPVDTVYMAARRCYSSKDSEELYWEKPDEKLILKLQEDGHESPFEHASFTFAVDGVSRALLAQLTRHRIASFSVMSQRYSDNGKNFDYAIPDTILDSELATMEYEWIMREIFESYTRLEQLGIPREDARYVLPNATCTKIVFTMNVRSLWNFFELRTCQHAQWEIRELANDMLTILIAQWPLLFDKNYCKGCGKCGK